MPAGHPKEWVDATATKQHIDWLRTKGVTMTAIAMEVGVTMQSVAYLRATSRWVRRYMQDAILDIEPDLATRPERDDSHDDWKVDSEMSRRARGARVPKQFSIRRIRALQCQGWPIFELSERVGFNIWNVLQTEGYQGRDKQHGRGDKHVTWRYEKIVALYDELWDVQGPSWNTRVRALQKGWHLPMCWDNIDDMDAKPMCRGRHEVLISPAKKLPVGYRWGNKMIVRPYKSWKRWVECN